MPAEGGHGRPVTGASAIAALKRPVGVALGLCVSILSAGHGAAADLSVLVRTKTGRPATETVVTVYPSTGGDMHRPIHFDWPLRMQQRNLAFSPFVLIAPVGGTVAFPNLDSVRHNVYSFSPVHPFELKLYGADQTRSVRFDKAGVVALGCNIHDSMTAFIKVVDTPYAAKTNAEGLVELRGLPAGAASLHIWRPYLNSPNNEIVRAITIGAAATTRQVFTVDLRSAPDPRQTH
jgi:plastocyanin